MAIYRSIGFFSCLFEAAGVGSLPDLCGSGSIEHGSRKGGANDFFGVSVGLLEGSNTGVDPSKNLKSWISTFLETNSIRQLIIIISLLEYRRQKPLENFKKIWLPLARCCLACMRFL